MRLNLKCWKAPKARTTARQVKEKNGRKDEDFSPILKRCAPWERWGNILHACRIRNVSAFYHQVWWSWDAVSLRERLAAFECSKKPLGEGNNQQVACECFSSLFKRKKIAQQSASFVSSPWHVVYTTLHHVPWWWYRSSRTVWGRLSFPRVVTAMRCAICFESRVEQRNYLPVSLELE